MKEIDFKKLKNILGKLPRALAEQAFLTILVLIFISLIWGGFLFYQYSILAQKAEPEITIEPTQFKENLYQKILEEWQNREERFQEAPNGKKLSAERTQELLSYPQIQELLNATNLYEFYTTKGEEFLPIKERAQIWQELELGSWEEYQGTYSQNIRLLRELKKELTE